MGPGSANRSWVNNTGHGPYLLATLPGLKCTCLLKASAVTPVGVLMMRSGYWWLRMDQKSTSPLDSTDSSLASVV